MTFRIFMLSACFTPWAWLVAAPSPVARESVPSAEKSLAALILDLSDERFKVRETATRKIWEMGGKVLPELAAVVDSEDPEVAYRARELVRKISLYITPETDPVVMRLVERYAKAPLNEKQDLLSEMVRKRAWRQVLGLLADEKNPDILRKFDGGISAVAVTAARECLLVGNTAEARDFLEMAPADPAGLLALAEFHRSQGTLEAEVARAKTLGGKVGDAWLLALYRASGNLDAARTAADAAGEPAISAILSMMLGDPQPWLQWSLESGDEDTENRVYTQLALERWQGTALGPEKLAPLLRALAAGSPQSRALAINSLYLLGEVKPAEDAYIKRSKIAGFTHFEMLERIPEAFAVFGLDPAQPDYSAWVAKRFAGMNRDQNDPDRMRGTADSEANELLVLANFMDSRGMATEFEDSFGKPLEELAVKDERAFTDFLARMFAVNSRFDIAPDLIRRVAYDWAGDDDDRWESLVHAAFGDSEQTATVWEWLAELDPGTDRIGRFDAMLALAGKGTDPRRLRERWLNLGWQAVADAPEADREEVLAKLGQVIALKPDVANRLKLWGALAEGQRDEFFRDSRISELTIAGRWDEASDIFLEQLALVTKFKQNPSPMLHAGAAACLRKAGRLEEAAEQDRWVDLLYLGSGAYQISVGYRFGDDYERSAQWLGRAVREDAPDLRGDYRFALREYGTNLLDAGRWKEAAAALEVSAQMANYPPDFPQTVLAKLTLRLEADLAHALSILGTNRAASLVMLERAYATAPGDGVLADYFFPAVRNMGLIAEHDAWFKTSWARLSAVADRYPGACNTHNTIGWLGARAHRNLDAARAYEKQALALKPDESSFLDTMGEIEFAAGNREKALEWSQRAVEFTPGGISDDGYGSTEESFMLRRQREHFRNDPMPR